MILHTLVVDDEPLARERLKLLLHQEKDVEVIGECGNGTEALAYLRSSSFDLLFLDIQMPERSGLEVVEELGMLGMPATVFVTAYQEHAVRAFEVEAIDYLTKPVEPDRLRLTLDRVRKALEAKTALLTQSQFTTALREMRSSTEEPKRYLSRILVRDGVKDLLLPTQSIEWVEAADYYSGLHVNGRTFMLRESITELAAKLDPAIFLRLHRSAIVNLNHVAEIYREGPDEGTVVLLSGQKLKMSKTGRLKLTQLAKL
jgi:two-component system LytT family response regulator